jgi:DNA repair exonuclease SbcCD ATPase subunit
MADWTPSGGELPTWLTAVLSVITTVAGWKALGPVAKWAGKRLDIMQQTRANERGDFLTQTLTELKSAREEMVGIRQELAEERELRMAVVVENAELRRDVEHLTRTIAEDKRDCQRAIRRLEEQIRELRRQQGGPV